MNDFRYRLARFFYGRCGQDDLARFMIRLSFVFLILSIIRPLHFLYLPGVILLVLSYVRMLSRNLPKRYSENTKFLQIRNRLFPANGKVRRFTDALGYRWRSTLFSLPGKLAKADRKLREMKEYHIYRCPSCRQKIRIPRGKGKIIIRCPKCGSEFIKKS